jgi:hypothetical protein
MLKKAVGEADDKLMSRVQDFVKTNYPMMFGNASNIIWAVPGHFLPSL